MTEPFNRRRLIVGAAQALAVYPSTGVLSAIDYDKPAPGSESLTVQDTSGLMIFRWNNRAIGTYRAHSSQKYPYFYPLAGPVSGKSLVAESALPYPHHRGLWLGCQPLNGGDFWGDTSLDSGQVRSGGLKAGKATPQSAVFSDRCEWVRKDAPSPLEDTRTFTVEVDGKRRWWLDADIILTAREEIVIKQAKHSFFALRVIPELSPLYGGVLANSAGDVGAEATYGKPAHWCGYHGKTAPNVVEGLAIMDHPGNPWNPCPWFTRDYGHMSPSPFAFIKQPWTLAKGKTIRLRYRVVMHAGTPKEAGLDELYRKWIA
ncbi:MAG TPA: PmoA family protein [Bryobacteraceae bacterium]|nr:PmoA family protein [Bryobacteraceae bacterium]